MSATLRLETGCHISFAVAPSVGAHFQLRSFLQIMLKVITALDFMLISNINQQIYGTEVSLGTSAYLLTCMTYVCIITEC